MKTVHPFTFLWLGFLLAISFFEAPLKFQAPSIDLKEGLDIGKLVFYWLNKIELVFLFIITASLLAWKESQMVKGLISLLWLILLVQSLWLLPALNERVLLYLAAEIPASSYHHVLYISLEVVKVILIIWLALCQINTYKSRVIAQSRI